MTENYVDWLYHRLIAQRAEADPKASRRALLMVIAGLSTIGNGEPTKALFRAKIGSLQFVRELVAQDPSLLETLQLPLERTRWISEKASATTNDFVDAVVNAFRGQRGVTLQDTRGEIHDVALVTLRTADPPITSVIISQAGQRGVIADDFRLQLLTPVGAEIAERLEIDRGRLELSALERARLLDTLEAQTPEQRLRTLDDLLKNRFVVFLSRIYDHFGKGQTYVEALRPPRVDETIRYLGGEDNRLATLSERFPLDEIFGRLVLLPIALPDELIRTYQKQTRSERRKILRHLQKLTHSAFPAMHFLRLLLNETDKAETRSRILRKLFGGLVSRAELGPLIDYARWVFVELDRRPDGQSLHARLLTAWTTAASVTLLASQAGVTGDDVFEVLDLHGQPEALLMGRASMTDPLSPIHMKPIEVAIRVLFHFFEDQIELREGLANLFDSSVVRTDSPWPIHVDLYPPFMKTVETTPSIFSTPIEHVISTLLGDAFSPEIRATFSIAYATDVIKSKVSDEPIWWHFLRRRTIAGDTPIEIAQALAENMRFGPDKQLLDEHRAEWIARIITMAQALAPTNPSEVVTFLAQSMAIVEDAPDGQILALTLIRAASLLMESSSSRQERVDDIEDWLEKLVVSRSRDIRKGAWNVALLLRGRLAAAEVSPRLSRVILLGRKYA